MADRNETGLGSKRVENVIHDVAHALDSVDLEPLSRLHRGPGGPVEREVALEDQNPIAGLPGEAEGDDGRTRSGRPSSMRCRRPWRPVAALTTSAHVRMYRRSLPRPRRPVDPSISPTRRRCQPARGTRRVLCSSLCELLIGRCSALAAGKSRPSKAEVPGETRTRRALEPFSI
jgi:hypothetical protein